MRRATRSMLVTVTLFAAADRLAAAPLGSAITFQGQLKQDGKPVDDTCELFFSLYDAETNGTSVADVGPTTLDVTDGLFSVELDFGAGAFGGDARWIEIDVACPPGGTMETLTPRQPVTAAPYALHALNGGGGGGDGHSLDAADGSPVNAVFVNNDGNVGVGTTAPTSRLQVHDGQLRFTGPAGTFLLNSTNAPSGTPVGDGFRMRFEGNFFGTNLDALVFEKTDGNELDPDGGMAFTNTGADGTEVPALVIRGDGRVGVGTISPENTLSINGISNFAGDVAVGMTAPTVRLDVLTGLTDTIARFRRSRGDLFNPVTAVGQITVGSLAQTGFAAPVESHLTLEAESTTGGGQNVVRIRSDVRPMEIISAGSIDIEAAGSLMVATANGGMISINNSSLPNIVSGSSGNMSALGSGSTISGGGFAASGFDPPGTHLVTDHNCTIGGGAANQAGNNNADSSDARNATVAGGVGNIASGRGSSIGGGRFNTASGLFSVVPGGFSNVSGNTCSFAAGCQARANHHGSFVWSDAFPTDTSPTFSSSADNQFNVRANGGVRIASATHSTTGAILAGVQLASGASAWSVLSDRSAKENFELTDGRDTLERLAGVPIETWNYKAQNADIRHMGPMAQDFYGAFGLGEDEQRISTIDADGVALSAIQGLYEIVQEKDAQIADLAARIVKLEAMMAGIATTSIGESK